MQKQNLALTSTPSAHTTPTTEPSLDDLFGLQTTLTPEGAGEALGTLSEPTVYSTYTSISLALEKLSHPPCVHCALVPIILLVIGTAGEFPYPAFPRGWSWRPAEQKGQSVPSCWQQGPESRIPGGISGGLFSADFPPLPALSLLELCAVRDLLARSRLYFLQRHCSRHLLFYSTLECEEI